MSPAWPREGEVDPLEAVATAGQAWPTYCMVTGLRGDDCTRAPGHLLPHVAADLDQDDPEDKRTVVTDVWLTLSGDDALAPLLDAITATAGDRADAVRAAVLDALGVGG